MSIDPTSPLAQSDIFCQGVSSTENLTPEDMLLYVQMRLESIDEQINVLMEKQKVSETVRKALQTIQNELAKVDENAEGGGVVDMEKINEAMNTIAQADPGLAKSLEEGLVGFDDDLVATETTTNGVTTLSYSVATGEGRGEGKINQDQIGTMRTTVDNCLSDLESSAQLDMLKLQSLIAARNNCISFGSNGMSACGEGIKTITGNIR